MYNFSHVTFLINHMTYLNNHKNNLINRHIVDWEKFIQIDLEKNFVPKLIYHIYINFHVIIS